MFRVAVKGDKYKLWDDTYKDPSKRIPPPPDPLNPYDQNKYSYAPSYSPLFNVNGTNKPNTGEEFVFCQGKPVIFSGYQFSFCKNGTYTRSWELDDDNYLVGTRENPEDAKHKDEDGRLIPPYRPGKRTGNGAYKDECKSTDEVNVWAVKGSDFVFIDGQPMSCQAGGVAASGIKWVIVEGKLEPSGTVKVEGEFTECYGHVYVES